MLIDEAIRFVSNIEALCASKGVWVNKTEINKPDLKQVKVEISIRVDASK